MIISPGNARIKSVVRMRQKAKARKEADAFLVEGVKMFLEAPLSRILEVYVSESFSCPDAAQNQAVIEKLKTAPAEYVSEEVFAKISDTCSPQGILCVMRAYHYELEDMLRGENPLLLLAEDIQDPGNLGTMLRTGEGAGIDGVICSRDTVDLYNPKTIRATMGSIYRVPFLYADDLHAVMKELQARGITIFAAHLRGETPYDACDYTRGAAFLIGNEGNGLKQKTADLADRYMKIPMAGEVESLNAGIAAAILTYEAARQRRAKMP
ncbi:MAG: RNA methyltransferase [Lachnospiraceae bacterium]|nr:RNA methyltransferase [Lachnospiraceae bacterium]